MATALISGRVVLTTATMLLVPSAIAQTASAGVTAKVVTPAEITLGTATEWLLGESPGVFALRIPGSSSAMAAPTASTTDNNSGLAGSADLAKAALFGIPEAWEIIPGTINGQGVQVVVTRANSNGNDIIVAIVTFD